MLDIPDTAVKPGLSCPLLEYHIIICPYHQPLLSTNLPTNLPTYLPTNLLTITTTIITITTNRLTLAK